VPYPNPFEVEVAFGKFKIYKSSGSDQIPTGLIQAGGETLGFEIRKLTNSIWNMEELPHPWEGVYYCANLKEG
jgi:hypothetical protein